MSEEVFRLEYTIAPGKVIDPDLREHDLWDRDVLPLVQDLPKNVIEIWKFAFTEMANNVLDHSEGETLYVSVQRNSNRTTIWVIDDGVGIFNKILRDRPEIEHATQAIFELKKGRLTTDPLHHTGLGILFVRHMVDEFNILSGELAFLHDANPDDYVFERTESEVGTAVLMGLADDSQRTMEVVMTDHSPGGVEIGDMVMPIRLMNLGQGSLISRSQAKLLITRVKQFDRVILDFEGIDQIGQGFADEIFRVFANSHPEILIVTRNTSQRVASMIEAARTGWKSILSLLELGKR